MYIAKGLGMRYVYQGSGNEVPYSGKFSRGSMFCSFRGELFTAKIRAREILNTCIQNILHFVPEVEQLYCQRSARA